MRTPAVTRVQILYYRVGAALDRRFRRVPLLADLLDAWLAYSRDEMAMLAAALAYYLLLALFPLVLLLIALASPFLNNEELVRQAVRFVANYLPAAAQEVRLTLREVLVARGPATLIATVGLLWSASGVFDLVQRGLNRAWHVAQPRPLWRQRLLSLLTVLGVGVLFGLSFAASAIGRSGFRLRVDLGSERIELVGILSSVVLNLLLFAVIYKVFPYAQVRWRQVWGGALLASVLWELAKFAFVWYLLNLARLSLVYGSLGAVIALLLWGYITATILLFGAEVTALSGRKSDLVTAAAALATSTG